MSAVLGWKEGLQQCEWGRPAVRLWALCWNTRQLGGVWTLSSPSVNTKPLPALITRVYCPGAVITTPVCPLSKQAALQVRPPLSPQLCSVSTASCYHVPRKKLILPSECQPLSDLLFSEWLKWYTDTLFQTSEICFFFFRMRNKCIFRVFCLWKQTGEQGDTQNLFFYTLTNSWPLFCSHSSGSVSASSTDSWARNKLFAHVWMKLNI